MKKPCEGAFVECKTGFEDKSPHHFSLKEPYDKINILSSNTHHASCTNPGESCRNPTTCSSGNKVCNHMINLY